MTSSNLNQTYLLLINKEFYVPTTIPIIIKCINSKSIVVLIQVILKGYKQIINKLWTI
jgi:hypothetical protein